MRALLEKATYGCVLLFCLSSCDRRVEVDHPFYLMSEYSELEQGLYRCPNGPDGGCAIDGLPGATIVAAGANEKFVVVEQVGSTAGASKFYYFARVPEETGGWGNNPEKVIGPLDAQEFERAKVSLRLPEFTVRR